MKCAKCGRDLDHVLVDVFDRFGNDHWTHYPLDEHENGAYVDVDPNWTGDELSEAEMRETILCPYCQEYPMADEEIQTYNYVRVVMFNR